MDKRYNLLRKIDEKVIEVKTSKGLKREFMTFELLQQDKFNEGVEKGVEKTKRENAIALLDVLDNQTIAKKIGLPEEEVKQLRKEHS